MDIFTEDDSSTPLTAEEKCGLRLKWITLRSELNEAEARNILDAHTWLIRTSPKDVLSDTFLRKLHYKMFGQVWDWAGKYRTTERNIGVAPYKIPINIIYLFDDIKFWIENRTYSEIEIAARFHHRLVQIHPFVNGNGRVSRMMADLCMNKLGKPSFTWAERILLK